MQRIIIPNDALYLGAQCFEVVTNKNIGQAMVLFGYKHHHYFLRLRIYLYKCIGRKDLLQLLFQRFSIGYPALFADSHTSFDFLSRIDDVIHVEVRKLYPDAELPSLPCERLSADRLVMHYSSPRGFGDLAEGLIAGCIKHFGEDIAVTRTDLPKEGTLHRVRFELVRQTA